MTTTTGKPLCRCSLPCETVHPGAVRSLAVGDAVRVVHAGELRAGDLLQGSDTTGCHLFRVAAVERIPGGLVRVRVEGRRSSVLSAGLRVYILAGGAS